MLIWDPEHPPHPNEGAGDYIQITPVEQANLLACSLWPRREWLIVGFPLIIEILEPPYSLVGTVAPDHFRYLLEIQALEPETGWTAYHRVEPTGTGAPVTVADIAMSMVATIKQLVPAQERMLTRADAAA